MPLRVAFRTLGCKLNQFETESYADAFARGGALVLPPDAEDAAQADLVVVNTCTVTLKADRSSRRILRQALAANPDSVVLVTGCYAQVEAAALASMDDRLLVLPGADKSALLGLPIRLADARREELLPRLRECLASATAPARGEASRTLGRFDYNPSSFAFHSRPALKIQDGCDNDCAYCRVRLARGPAASLGSREALARVRALEAAGRAEIVLTGVNLSQYRDGDMDFAVLLRFLIAGTERVAFRLSSYEPDGVDAAFLEVFADPRVRPHVHLALQSGADPVLAAMGRRYGGAEVLAAVEGLRRVKGDPFIGVDLIAGFPGETEADAKATLELGRACDFAWIHAFRFSPRPGTRAAAMPGRPSDAVVAARAEALLALGRENRAKYVGGWRGRELRAVLELGMGATAENYLKLKPRGLPDSLRPGQEILCRVDTLPVETSLVDGAGDFDALALYIDSRTPSAP